MAAAWIWCALAYEDERNEQKHGSEHRKSNDDLAFAVLLKSLRSYDLGTFFAAPESWTSQLPSQIVCTCAAFQ
jgi:hypothetical protein